MSPISSRASRLIKRPAPQTIGTRFGRTCSRPTSQRRKRLFCNGRGEKNFCRNSPQKSECHPHDIWMISPRASVNSGPRIPTSGFCSMPCASASSVPGKTSASLFKRNKYCACAVCRPWLAAGPNPLLSALAMIFVCGKSRRAMSVLPSAEALSTTTTSNGNAGRFL